MTAEPPVLSAGEIPGRGGSVNPFTVVADATGFIAFASEVFAAEEVAEARVTPPPTPFYGALTLARVEDPWSNLWWLFQPSPGQPDSKPAWEGGPTTVFSTVDRWMQDRSTG
ncbi:hypothetical protein [Amnibacterium kyonggiense]|uniref:Uncharacterized protein n=1 Tax=Amnibacterium kyonggiense TaxID=595671 RepID=A0A4R7FIL6_9MICO|nr:hypothetical protein [Amnibacterium kyonggiense]TDS76071.1 hypothetical protein CLV52_3187 [Amnibacterium kyonggiense]